MNKYIKIVIALTIVLALSGLIWYGNYYIRRHKYPKLGDVGSTGGKVEQQSQSEIIKGEAISKLIKALPLSTSSFSITKYDYSNGKFIVVGYNGAVDLQKDFNTWLQNSDYKTIPKEMFLLQP